MDSLSKDGFQRTYLNKPKPKDNSMDLLPEDEKERLQREFINEHEKEMKEFGMLSKFDDSRRYLQERPHLVCDWTNNYLIIWCVIHMPRYIFQMDFLIFMCGDMSVHKGIIKENSAQNVDLSSKLWTLVVKVTCSLCSQHSRNDFFHFRFSQRCLNLEMEGKSELSQHVAHQSTCLNYILELGKQLEVDPRGCVSSFFNRIQNADKVIINLQLKMFHKTSFVITLQCCLMLGN